MKNKINRNLNTKFTLYCVDKTNLTPLMVKDRFPRSNDFHNYINLALKFLELKSEKSKIIHEKIVKIIET